MPPVPAGVITFLFTDIEGSTKLWETYPNEMNQALAYHDTLLREIIENNNGYVFKTVGDAFCAAFQAAPDAVLATLEIQHHLQAKQWPPPLPIKVRIGLHSGPAQQRDNDYFGPTLNRLARLFSVGYGGQILLSQATIDLIGANLPPQVTLRDLGWHRFKDLAAPQAVFQLVAPDLPADFPPLKSLNLPEGSLPAEPLTELIGRDAAITEISGLLQQSHMRLLTLTGVGGTGKTRLSLAVARALRSEFADGVYFVPLETVTRPETFLEDLQALLGIKEASGQSLLERLKAYLAPRQMLLVLDNFEQLVEAGPVLVSLLKAAPRLKMLVTSRISLRLSLEREYPVAPLNVPARIEGLTLSELTQYAAIALFVARAQLIRPNFALTTENAPAVAEICWRLDGLPLAIELAAARLRAFTPQKLLERLSLALLGGGAKDLPTRQQTLRGMLDWSYDLLSRDEQKLFNWLGIFAGGARLEAVEAVCTELDLDVFEGLEGLVIKNLLKQQLDIIGETRYTMLQTIQEYARYKLAETGESETAATRYADYYSQWALDQAAQLNGTNQVQVYREFDSEYDNLRSALDWLLHPSQPVTSIETALRLATTLAQFWSNRGQLTEGRNWLSRVLALAENQPVAEIVLALAFKALGTLSNQQVDYTSAQHHYEQSLAILRKLGDHAGVASLLNNLGAVARERGDYNTARPFYEASLAQFRVLENERAVSIVLNNLAMVARDQKDYNQARRFLEESLGLARRLKSPSALALTLSSLGDVAIEQNDYEAVRAYLNESLQINRELDDQTYLPFILEYYSGLAAVLNQPEIALRLAGAAAHKRELIEVPIPQAEHRVLERRLQIAREALGEVAISIWQAGRELTFEQAIELARSI